VLSSGFTACRSPAPLFLEELQMHVERAALHAVVDEIVSAVAVTPAAEYVNCRLQSVHLPHAVNWCRRLVRLDPIGSSRFSVSVASLAFAGFAGPGETRYGERAALGHRARAARSVFAEWHGERKMPSSPTSRSLAPDLPLKFVGGDRSRNGLRRWCEMQTCGTLAKSRRRAERRHLRRRPARGGGVERTRRFGAGSGMSH
jgi:hypothetical protein